MKHGTVVRPTMYMASLDIKTAFDEAKPKHVAKIMDSHNTHGWIIAALLREMSGLSGKAILECVESSLALNRCLKPALAAKDGKPDIGQCGGRMDQAKKKVFLWIFKEEEEVSMKFAVLCGPTTSGSYPTIRNTWSRC